MQITLYEAFVIEPFSLEMKIMNELAIAFWQDYSNSQHVPENLRAYRFGDTPDELAQLVATGVKTTTSNALKLLQFENKKMPKVGDYNIILNKQFEPVVLIQIIDVQIRAYDSVDEAFAIAEGDGSYENWDAIHVRYFTEKLAQYNEPFSRKMDLVCQTFRVLKVHAMYEK